MNTTYKSNNNIVYSCKYHVVWCPKYRRKVLINGVDVRLKELLFECATNLSVDILELEIMPDHVHLLVSCKPQLRLSDAIKVLKGNTARWLFLNYPEIKSELWGGHLWNPSYFVATVSERTEEQIKMYMSNQKSK